MKLVKITIIINLLLNCLVLAQSQDLVFTEMADLPKAKSALTSANDGESIFVVNGFGTNEQYTSEIYQLDITQNSWTVLTASAIPKRFASAAIVGEYLYVFNGLGDNAVLNEKVEKIDLSDGSIQSLSDNPQPSRAAGVATWNNKIYSFGGEIAPNEYSSKLYEFDPQNDSWIVLSDIPFSGETKGEIVNGKLYIFGGYNGTVSDRIDVYDIQTNTWESNFQMPNGISAHSTAIVGDKIYLVGDFINLTSIAYFDTSDNSFHLVTSNLNARRHCAAEGVGESLFAIGGNTTSSIQSSISSVQKADMLTSLNEVVNIQLFEVYPNPTSAILNLSTKFDQIIIYNANGQEVSKHANTTQIKIEGLANGTYFLTGYLGQEKFQSSFMKF